MRRQGAAIGGPTKPRDITATSRKSGDDRLQETDGFFNAAGGTRLARDPGEVP
jgi:hypothetical protein